MFKRFWWIVVVCIPVGMFCGSLLALGASYLMPKLFESRCVMELRPPATFPPKDGLFSKTMQRAVSRECLEPVVDNQILTEAWGMDREACVGKLREAVCVDSDKGTDLVILRVRARSPEDARDLAQAVAQSYATLLTKDLADKGGTTPDFILHSPPTLAMKPVSPNVLFILSAGSAVGMVLALVIALPLMALLHRKYKA